MPDMFTAPDASAPPRSASAPGTAGVLELPVGELARHADAVFERVSPYDGAGFRNHCRRLFHFSEMLMHQSHAAMNRDVAYAVAMCHDLGIVSRDDTGPNYLERSRSLFARETASFDLGGTPTNIIDECMIYNHRVLAVPNLSAQADAFRRAVQIEHSHGLLRFGLDPAAVKQVFARYPRGNFDRVLLDFTWRTLTREPLTLVHGIFF